MVNIEYYGNEMRVILIGDSGVGKSSIFRHYSRANCSSMPDLNESFDYYPGLVGTDWGEARLVLYDTAGQEKFRSLTRSYYRKSHGVMMVYDVTNRKSFESLDGWHKEALKFVESKIGIYYLIGNKIDKEAKKEVSYKEAMHFAQKNNCKLFETSAITGHNVDETFHAMARDVQEARKRPLVPKKTQPGTRNSSTIHLTDSKRRPVKWWKRCFPF